MFNTNNKNTSHILLYHSVLENNSKNITRFIENVTPENLYLQISWIKQYYDFVNVDDLAISYQCGKCAVTFDDGYNSVFINAAPILDELNVPYTVYLNGSTLENKIFWRDKIRFIIQNELIDLFIKEFPFLNNKYKINKNNFFWQTKNPTIPSNLIDDCIDTFTKKNNIYIPENNCINNLNIIKNLKGLTLGNHSYSHYILSSLDKKTQLFEIEFNHEKINELGFPISKLFSVPNGLYVDFNRTTLEIIKDLGYKGVLLSQMRTNKTRLYQDEYGLKHLHRFLIPNSLFELQKSIKNMEVNRIKWNLRKLFKPNKF